MCAQIPLLRNKAFRDDHCRLLKSEAPHIPTGLHYFPKHAKALKDGELQYFNKIFFKLPVQLTSIQLLPSDMA